MIIPVKCFTCGEVLANKLEGAENWVQCFVRRDMEYRRVVPRS